jgi:hypothetical protein
VLLTLFIGSSVLLPTGAIAWRIGMKHTMRALLEYRTARAGADSLLSRRVTELEEEVRGLKERLAALPESNPTRLLGADVPWARDEREGLSVAGVRRTRADSFGDWRAGSCGRSRQDSGA